MSYEYDDYERRAELDYLGPRPHSGFGIASFIIAFLVGAGEFVLVIACGVLTAQQGKMDDKSPVTVVLGLLLCSGILAAVVGLILGIAGVLQAGRNKTFAILGICFNGFIILGVVGLVIVGMLMSD